MTVSVFFMKQAVSTGTQRMCLTQCPSSVANTSFPSLIFPEIWLTQSLLPRKGCRKNGNNRVGNGGKRRKRRQRGRDGRGERRRNRKGYKAVYLLQLLYEKKILWLTITHGEFTNTTSFHRRPIKRKQHCRNCQWQSLTCLRYQKVHKTQGSVCLL